MALITNALSNLLSNYQNQFWGLSSVGGPRAVDDSSRLVIDLRTWVVLCNKFALYFPSHHWKKAQNFHSSHMVSVLLCDWIKLRGTDLNPNLALEGIFWQDTHTKKKNLSTCMVNQWICTHPPTEANTLPLLWHTHSQEPLLPRWRLCALCLLVWTVAYLPQWGRWRLCNVGTLSRPCVCVAFIHFINLITDLTIWSTSKTDLRGTERRRRSLLFRMFLLAGMLMSDA